MRLPSLFLSLCLAMVARADAAPPWTDHPRMERCFDGAQEFIQAAYGEAGTEDWCPPGEFLPWNQKARHNSYPNQRRAGWGPSGWGQLQTL